MKDNKKRSLDKKDNTYNAELTTKDMEKLGERVEHQRNNKLGDDAQLINREQPVDFTGKNLDVPGRTDPKGSKLNLKDEENTLYSQGSGHNDHLEDAENHQ